MRTDGEKRFSVTRVSGGRGLWVGGPALLLCALALATPLSAQVDLEVRGGVAVGSHSASAAGLETVPRLSYEALVTLNVRPDLRVYGSFVRTAFGCEEGFCLDRDLTVTGTHGAAGLEWAPGLPWVRAGLLYGTTTVGDDGNASDPGLGVQAAVGVALGSGRVRVLPGISYRRFSDSTDGLSHHATALTVDLGVRIRLTSG